MLECPDMKQGQRRKVLMVGERMSYILYTGVPISVRWPLAWSLIMDEHNPTDLLEMTFR